MNNTEALRIARITLAEDPETVHTIYHVTEAQKLKAYDQIAELQSKLLQLADFLD